MVVVDMKMIDRRMLWIFTSCDLNALTPSFGEKLLLRLDDGGQPLWSERSEAWVDARRLGGMLDEPSDATFYFRFRHCNGISAVGDDFFRR